MVQVRNQSAVSPKQAGRRKSPFDRAFNVEQARALGDPARVRLLSCVLKCGRACTVSEIATCCDLDLSTVSRHLTKLASAGLLQSEKTGREVRYAADASALATSFRAIADAIEASAPSFGDDTCCDDNGCC